MGPKINKVLIPRVWELRSGSGVKHSHCYGRGPEFSSSHPQVHSSCNSISDTCLWPPRTPQLPQTHKHFLYLTKNRGWGYGLDRTVSMHETLRVCAQYYVNKVWWCRPVISSQVEAGGSRSSRSTLGYILSSKPAWTTRSCVSKYIHKY